VQKKELDMSITGRKVISSHGWIH